MKGHAVAQPLPAEARVRSQVLERFVMDAMELGQVFLPILRFSPVNIIPLVLHIHLHLHVALTSRTNGRVLGTFQQTVLFRKTGSV